jgi:hypothetical protein
MMIQALEIVGGIVLVLSMMAFASFNMSKQWGWAKLAESYQSQKTFPRPRMLFRQLRCGAKEYAACLTVAQDNGGLYLSMTLPIFRFGHPALFIPWTEIESKDARYLLSDRTELSFKNAPGVAIQISRKTAKRLKGLVK